MTGKQQKFVEEYCLCYNATKAYLKAYPDSTIENAQSNSYKLMKREDIKEAIKQHQKELMEKYGDVAQFLLSNLLEDIEERDEKGKRSATWQKSVDLAQKQLGLQQQKAEVKVDTTNISIKIEE